MTLYTKILNEFKNSNIKILSLNRLNQYINFCLDKNQSNKIKGKTSYHHILPQSKSCFPEFKDLKSNPWNGTHLLYSDHYYAHWLLTEAIDDYGQLSAFCAMHNKDLKLGRINESDLISSSEFQKKMEERGKKFTKWDNQYGKNRKLKQKETKNSKEWKETVGKEAIIKANQTKIKNGSHILGAKKAAKTKLNTFINGVSLSKIYSQKQQQVMKETKGYSRAAKKQKETKGSVEWKETVGKEAIIKMNRTKTENIKSGKLTFENISGKNNYATKTVLVCNDKNEIIMVSEGSLTKFLKEHKLPVSIRNTLHTNKKLYENNKTGGVSKEIIKKYKGWYLKFK